MVLPVDIGNAFIERARAMGWHLRLRTDVAETELRPPHRVLLAFSPTAGECFSDRLAIRGPEQQYSEGFTALTEDFISLCEPGARVSTGRCQAAAADSRGYNADRGSPYANIAQRTISSATCTRLRSSSKLFETRKRA